MDFALLEKGIWLGCAGIGFAVLFNAPRRTLGFIYIISALGGLLKFYLISLEVGLIFAALCGASFIGFSSVLAAHYRHSPPMTFALPALIPMIPGFFAYKAMVGIMKLTAEKDPDVYTKLFFETVNNGLSAWFIVLALSAGVAIPLLITRKETVKRIKTES
ncbi:threonine/serine exporter family protein [Flavobacterium adhaerens]|uniref:threonine/serine exporter family protein n=1 Tax=Flavobacterium adhaerens TaxID=3149043 RepID=UPI0032B4A7FC